ncbi:MAG: dihydrodipicolinate reductase [Thermoprotei archaeon]|nr:MAG: dihydrodipicolinate reductase [Thermoprotei archaeon]
MGNVRVVLYGVGAIGRLVAKTLYEKRKGVEIVGAIDIDVRKVGRDLGEIAGLGRCIGVKVSSDPDKVLEEAKPDVVILMTSSFLRKVYPQIITCLEHGSNVISTCEELSYPYIVDEELSRKIDEEARRRGLRVLGAGINPGFLMDLLPIVLTTPCLYVDKISVKRVIDASKRREPFQRKIGAGLAPEEFKRKIESGEITGHMGLPQSIALIAKALDWKLDEIKVKEPEPIIADKTVKTQFLEVEAGMVAGLEQAASGIISGEEKITLLFRASVSEQHGFDSIDIIGDPPIHFKTSPEVHGDTGTVGTIVNLIPGLLKAPPGLLTVVDLLLTKFHGTLDSTK